MSRIKQTRVKCARNTKKKRSNSSVPGDQETDGVEAVPLCVVAMTDK